MSGIKEYERRASHKLRVYQKNLISVIAMYPKELNRDWRSTLLTRMVGILKKHSADMESRSLL